MTNYQKLAQRIIEEVGGKANVSSATHCMTRLRLVLKDEGLADDAKLNAIPEVISVVHAGGQVPARNRARPSTRSTTRYAGKAALKSRRRLMKIWTQQRGFPGRSGSLRSASAI